MKPNCNNACSGEMFQDWLEVNLTAACNASCSWCVERRGWHPEHEAHWSEIVASAIKSGKKNIILLGGEPTLHPHLFDIIKSLKAADLNVWLTTNGSFNSAAFVEKLVGLKGINISCHHYDLNKNREITGVYLSNLCDIISVFNKYNIHVRLNCNLIKGYIDNETEIYKYIAWAKFIEADKVRFAELKFDNENFIDLAKIMHYNYGLTDDPYLNGCWKEVVINKMQVNFRQMCGLQTSKRVMPENPEQVTKPVLYYDGKIYDGWQVPKESRMENKDIADRLVDVAQSLLKLAQDIKNSQDDTVKTADIDAYVAKVMAQQKSHESGGGCVY